MSSNTEISEEIKRKLESIQAEMDSSFEVYLRKEFDLKLEFQKENKKLLNERDEIIRSLTPEQFKNIISTAIDNLPELHSMLPIITVDNVECYDTEFIKFIKTEYLEGYKIKITVELYENDYVENTLLERTICFTTKEDSLCQVKYKEGVEPIPFFSFFTSDEDLLEMSDLLCECYYNLK